jgi:hypothetical protein
MSDDTPLPRMTGVPRSAFNHPTLTVSNATTAKDLPGWGSMIDVASVIEVDRQLNVKLQMTEPQSFIT